MTILAAWLQPARGEGRAATSATRPRRVLSLAAYARAGATTRGPAGNAAGAWVAWIRAEMRRHAHAGHDQESAWRLAYGAAVNEWRKRHGARPDPGRCAGCGESLGAASVIGLADGAPVHADERLLGCTIAYGRRWRGAAEAALARLGIAEGGTGWRT